MQEILFYSGIYDFTAEEFINRLNEIPKDEDIIVRLNSPGGSVFAGWGIIAALKERTGRNILKVDGNASSMAFIMVPFFDEVIALDVTSFMVHRASAYIENDDDKKMLDNANRSLREKLEKRIDSDKFKEITGVTIKDIFESNERRDIWLTAKQAKKVGLVDKVVRLEPREIQAMKNNLVAFCNTEAGIQSQGSDKEPETINNSNKKEQKMTLESFKKENPDLFAQIISMGVKQEKDRVDAFMAFIDIDPKAVKEAIEKGDTLTQKFTAEMTVKAIKSAQLNQRKEDSPENVEVDVEDPKSEDDKQDVEFKKAEMEALKAAGVKMEG